LFCTLATSKISHKQDSHFRVVQDSFDLLETKLES
jgi:hypothetical protein